MGKAKIELQNISKSYYSGSSVTQALHKVSLTFVQGEFVAITGESGSGKSTLLNIIGGIDNFDEGEMIVNGRPTFQYTDEDWENYRRSQIGYIFQDYSLIGHYTALDNVISALLIMGINKEEAHHIAMDYLKRVGLKGLETHPATELSSGQKQRLSIARALAKNTGIIVADEPTGNLDSETGRQIVELLKELSENCLVIMVTHNYSQAEPYVTRKIRLHEGIVISDVSENTGEYRQQETDLVKNLNTIYTDNTSKNFYDTQEDKYEKIPLKEKLENLSECSRRNNSLAMWFAHLNIRTQYGRTIMFTSFLFIISLVSFLFIGELHLQADDIFTKEYSQDAFYKKCPERLIAAHTDKSEITDNDIKNIQKIKYVKTADPCSIANDINYYIDEGPDYKYIYGRSDTSGFGQQNSRGGKTVSFLNEKHFMMSASCITEKDLSEGYLPESKNEIAIYSDDTSIIGTKKLCYFTAPNIWGHDEYYQTNLIITGILKENKDQVYFSDELCNTLSVNTKTGEFRICYDYSKAAGDFNKKALLTPVINYDLQGNDVHISSKFDDRDEISGEIPLQIQYFDENGNFTEEKHKENVNLLKDFHKSTASFLEVSEELYNKYYNKKSCQISVYISDYAKTDYVLHKLKKQGYKAVSTYRVSVEEYVEGLVNERLVIICICTLGLVILMAAGILILCSLMKIRIKDYQVLKFIGMKLKTIDKISCHETCIYSISAMIPVILIMLAVGKSTNGIIKEIMWYYSYGAYIEFILYNLILAILAAKAFNHTSRGRLQA